MKPTAMAYVDRHQDSGISNLEEIASAAARIDVIVLDHHLGGVSCRPPSPSSTRSRRLGLPLEHLAGVGGGQGHLGRPLAQTPFYGEEFISPTPSRNDTTIIQAMRAQNLLVIEQVIERSTAASSRPTNPAFAFRPACQFCLDEATERSQLKNAACGGHPPPTSAELSARRCRLSGARGSRLSKLSRAARHHPTRMMSWPSSSPSSPPTSTSPIRA